MLNRPTSPWSNELSDGAAVWDVDRNPQFRFALLWLGFAAALISISLRVGQLQINLHEKFATPFSETRETIEEIPVCTGRILSADGTILATDTQTYDVAVYYPVIQDPPSQDWLEGRAKSRLSKKDKRNRQKVALEKEAVLAEQSRFWDELARLTHRSPAEILESRRAIQSRIESAKAAVARHHRMRQMQSASENVAASEETLWMKMADLLQSNRVQDRILGPDRIAEEDEYHTVIADVTADIRDEITAHAMRYPYAQIRVQQRRVYPQGELASHLIGHRKPITEEELKERKEQFPNDQRADYRLGDSIGMSGLERQYELTLRGTRGKRSIVTHRGEVLETREIQAPRHGRDVILSLDSTIQHRAEQILDRAIKRVIPGEHLDEESSQLSYAGVSCPTGGAIVAIDVYTGAILAAASAPRFDLNLLISAERERWLEVLSDKRSPLFSRATGMKLTPGSVFKVITSVAALETGALSADTICHCQGYLESPDKPHRCYTFLHHGVGHGDVDLADALCRSCNIFFYTAAKKMGPQPIVDWATKCGIGQRTGIDLPSEEAGTLPTPATAKRRWTSNDTLDLSIGQSTLEVTPLQMARVMALFANDGQLVTPHLAQRFGPTASDDLGTDDDSALEWESSPVPGLHHRTIESIRQGMIMAVNNSHGTAYKTVRMKEITIAGKTGTAQTHGVDHAWFAGYVPVDRPRFAFVVVLEHGGSGGKAAGPVAHDLIQSLLEQDALKATKLARDH